MQWLKISYQCQNAKWLQDEHNCAFTDWLSDKVHIEIENGVVISDALHWMSQGPLPFVVKHTEDDTNGFHFVTRDPNSTRVNQNRSYACC